jgi:hypothetical protein
MSLERIGKLHEEGHRFSLYHIQDYRKSTSFASKLNISLNFIHIIAVFVAECSAAIRFSLLACCLMDPHAHSTLPAPVTLCLSLPLERRPFRGTGPIRRVVCRVEIRCNCSSYLLTNVQKRICKWQIDSFELCSDC